MNIIFVDSLPNERSGSCIFYDNYRHSQLSKWNIISLKEICRDNSKNWNHALCEWHANLLFIASKQDKFAFLLPGSRIHLWQNHLKALYFCLGLKKYVQSNNMEELFIVGAPNEVKLIFEDIYNEPSELYFNKKEMVERLVFDIFKYIYEIIRSIGSVIFYWRPFYNSKSYKNDIDALVFSLFFPSNSKNYYNDHYFGKVFEKISKKSFWLYKPTDRFNEYEARRSLLYLKGRYEFDIKLLDIVDLFWCLRKSFSLNIRMRNLFNTLPILKIGDTDCNLFSKLYFREHYILPFCFSELVLLRSTKKLIRIIKPKIVFFPYEEKGFERAILIATSEHLPKIKVVGFAHSAYNSGYLYLGGFNDDRKIPRPDVIWASGPSFDLWLRDYWQRNSRVITIGTHRYVSSNNNVCLKSENVSKLSVLIVTGNPYELFVLSNWLIELPDFLLNCNVTLRPHPQGWHKQNNLMSDTIRKLGIDCIDNKSPLIEQLNKSDIILYCSSSAVIEGIQRGNYAIRVAWDDLWESDPIRITNSFIQTCYTPKEVQEYLRDIKSMSLDDFQYLKNKQRPIADSIYSKFDPLKLDKLISDVI